MARQARALHTPAAGPKPDKDMGREVQNLGGFRPGQRLPAGVPIARYTEVTIIARGVPKRPLSRKLPWYKRPFLTFGR